MAHALVRTSGGILVQTCSLHLAAERRRPVGEVVQRLREGDQELHASFRTILSQAICAALHPDVPGLRNIYLFGSAADRHCRPTSDVDLLVHVAAAPGPVVDALERLNAEVSSEFDALMGRHARERQGLLDIHVVTDEDVTRRIGFAAILSSVHAPRVRLGPAVSF